MVSISKRSYQRMRCQSVLMLLLAVLPGLSLSQPVAKQATPGSEVFRGFYQAITLLRERLKNFEFTGSEYKLAAMHLVNTEHSLNGIEAVASRHREAKIPDQFLRSLKGQSGLLMGLATAGPSSKPDKARLLNTLSEVESDLELKLSYSTASLGQSLRPVQVIVHTVKESKEEAGYEVWYVPKALVANREYYAVFDRLSSPTDMEIPAGNYYFWIQKGTFASGKRPFSIGNDRKSRKEVDIPIL